MNLRERSLRMGRWSFGRAVSIGCAAVLLFACVMQGEASELKLSIVLTKDTFLPFEPITGAVFVTNLSKRTISIPDLGLYGASAFLPAVSTAAGKVLASWEYVEKFYGPGMWHQYQLAPGEVLSTGLHDLAQDFGDRGPRVLSHHAELEPGRYSIVVRWDPGTSESTGDSSDEVSFAVREPHSDEAAVLALYRAVLGCLDTLVLTEKRLGMAEHIARAVVWCHSPEAYAVLARIALDDIYDERLRGLSRLSERPELTPAWTDSLHFIDRDIITSYPNSPIAAAWLNQIWKFQFSDRATLSDLTNEFPDTYVGREAERLLTFLERSSNSK